MMNRGGVMTAGGGDEHGVAKRANALFQDRIRTMDVTDVNGARPDFEAIIAECLSLASSEAELSQGFGNGGTHHEEGTHQGGMLGNLLSRKHLDRVPVPVIVDQVVALAERLGEGQILHILLTGCNTCSVVMPLKTRLRPALHSCVWVLCTNEVWPADLSSCLWHFYGGLVSEDLGAFRANTRELLADFTVHWQRQAIVNPSMQEAAKMDIESLAHLVYLDRLDRVKADASGLFPVMALL